MHVACCTRVPHLKHFSKQQTELQTANSGGMPFTTMAAHRPYAGVCFLGGSAWSGGWCLIEGVCLVWGVSAWSGGGVCLVWGGGWCLPGPGGSPCRWGVLPAQGGCPETPPVNRITHTCKNITLATTSLRPVIM